MTGNKIMICYAWGRPNAGDHALILGALEQLERVVDLSEIIVVTRHSDDDPISPKAYIEERFPKVKVVPPPFDMKKRRRFAKIPQVMEAVVKAAGVFVFPNRFRHNQPENSFWQALASTRLVLLNGGNLFFWHKVRHNLPRLIALAFPLLLAKRLKIPYGMLPQTCGPFDKGLVSKWIGRVFSHAKFVTFRDKSSIESLASIISLERIRYQLLPDLAFSLTSRYAGNPQMDFLSSSKDYFCVSLRVAALGDDVSKKHDNPIRTEEKILSILPKAISGFQEMYGLHCIIVVQVCQDQAVSEKLLAALCALQSDCSIIRLEDPYDFIELYRKAQFLLTFRLHSMIFALAQGTPVVGIWRKPLGTKIPSMMKDMALEDYCIELDSLDHSNLLDKLALAYRQREDLRKDIRSSVQYRDKTAHEFYSKNLV
ncbi:MAG: hypothetical protein A2293_14825 [Elusimicrobia bacterium RIFOXYB2_FULL_49_7]|nr:MAG: hypothetical protein A2293_14825 [Elusimicrobia bacterium RIFOXYB2_FULL_49_7]